MLPTTLVLRHQPVYQQRAAHLLCRLQLCLQACDALLAAAGIELDALTLRLEVRHLHLAGVKEKRVV